MKKIIMIGGGAFALVAISVGASLFLSGVLSEPPPAAAVPVEVEVKPEEVYYYNLQPEFVVNFQGKSRVKFLMIEMVVSTHDEDVVAILSDHDPELRNAMLTLLAEQNSEELKTTEGKQALRDEALVRVNEVVAKHYQPDRVEEVFITRLVMQ